MPDVLFRSGRPAYLQLKVGAGATMNLKVVGGTGYSMGDNDVNEDLGAGTMNAAPKNMNTGLFTPVLDVVCRLFAPSGGAGWFSAANLQAMFGSGAAGDFSLRANVNGDLPLIEARFSNGLDVVLDQVKIARFSIEGSGASNDLVCRMTFLGLGLDSEAVFGNYVDSVGKPLYWKNVTNTKWFAEGGADVTTGGIERLSLGVATGLSYGKFNDATDFPSSLDPAASLAGAVSVVQRSGVETASRMLNARNGVLTFRIADTQFVCGLNRQGRSWVANPSAGVMDRTNWQMAWVNSTFLAITAVV